MGRVVCPRRGHTTPRVSAIEILTTDLGVLYEPTNLEGLKSLLRTYEPTNLRTCEPADRFLTLRLSPY